MGKKSKSKKSSGVTLDEGTVMMSTVAGFEFSKEYPVDRDTVWILEHLVRGGGCVYWQTDDGPRPEVALLRELAKEGYFVYTKLDGYSHVVFIPEVCEVRV